MAAVFHELHCRSNGTQIQIINQGKGDLKADLTVNLSQISGQPLTAQERATLRQLILRLCLHDMNGTHLQDNFFAGVRIHMRLTSG